MNLEPLTRNRYYMAGRKQPMTRDEAFDKLVLQFPSCEIKSISDDHKYVTYCKVTRVCKICGYEWSTKVSNAVIFLITIDPLPCTLNISYCYKRPSP